jgi:cell division protein ZapA
MGSVQVEIFGQSYNIKADADHDRIRELAAYVDAKMKTIQKGTGTVDPHRVAILAALTISDELYNLKQEHSLFAQATEKSAQRLLEITEAAGDAARDP